MIAIVGGGISGLSAAWFAQKRGLDYTLLESSERWGGKLRTEHVQLNKGERFVVEGGPDSFLVQKPWAVQLAKELGLGERLLGTNDQLRTIYVLYKGKPIPLPEGVLLIVPTQFLPFALTPLISIPGKLRMALDLVIPRRKGTSDETLGAFVRRRLGNEVLERLAEPLMSGIYSAEADQQSLLATFPRFRQIETEHGSLIRGMLASRASAPKPVDGKKPSMFQSLPSGTQELVDTLVPKLTGKLRLRTAVEQLAPIKTGGYLLTLSDGSTLAADHVVLTTPAAVAAKLIAPFDPQIAEALRTIRTVSTGTISLGYHKKDIQRSLNGFGVVIPRGEKRPINALTLSSVKFDQRAPEGYALVRVFFGGSRTPETLQLDDSAILALACAQLKDILGIEAPPLFHRIFRWREANPQYDLGHLERMDILDSALPAGLLLTGCAYRGVGIPDCIKQSEDTDPENCYPLTPARRGDFKELSLWSPLWQGVRGQAGGYYNTMNTHESERLFARAQELIPGGVNSPVRAFRGVGGTPRFIERGAGAFIWDADGNRYTDYVLSWGPLILGHAPAVVLEAIAETAAKGTSYGAPTALENALAEKVIGMVPSIEQIRFVNSGTEACMSALRLARAATGREKIVKFSGCYHGHADLLLVQAGSGVATLGLPDSPGVPRATAASTLTLSYNDLDGAKALFAALGSEIAAVIVEPIAANMGFVLPEEGYLLGLQALCREHGALFILDEVMTGFRVAPGGAQAHWGLDPDLTCLGKVIGGGLPVGAYAGKKAIMQQVAPAGTMYQAGTLSGNPLAMAAGLATLNALTEPGVFDEIVQNTHLLTQGIADAAAEAGIPLQAGTVGTMFGFYLLNEPGAQVTDYATAKQYVDAAAYAQLFHKLLERGVYLAPSAFEAGFVSVAHTPEIIQSTLDAIQESLREL